MSRQVQSVRSYVRVGGGVGYAHVYAGGLGERMCRVLVKLAVGGLWVCRGMRIGLNIAGW